MYCLQFKISGSLFNYSNCLRFYITLALLRMMTFTKALLCCLQRGNWGISPWQFGRMWRQGISFDWSPLQNNSQISPSLVLPYACELSYFSSKSVPYSSCEVCGSVHRLCWSKWMHWSVLFWRPTSRYKGEIMSKLLQTPGERRAAKL